MGRGPFPLIKPQSGICPIEVGNIPWKLPSTLAVRGMMSEIGPYPRPLQVGVGVKGGCGRSVHSLNRVVEPRHSDPPLFLRKYTFKMPSTLLAGRLSSMKCMPSAHSSFHTHTLLW